MAQSVNDYLFRLALVINTSHSKFNDNLASIGFLFTRVFSLDLEKLKKEEHIKIEAQLQEIDTELSLLE